MTRHHKVLKHSTSVHNTTFNLMKLAEQNPTATVFLIMAFLIIVSYFAATYISGGASGHAYVPGSSPVCGNGVREGSEECDGGSAVCTAQNGYIGTQSCTSTCTFGPCSTGTQSCGDGKISGKESCDWFNSKLPKVTCSNFGYVGGALGCGSSCTTFDTSQCNSASACGNGIREDDEECDGADLGNPPTCQAMGFFKGTVKCGSNCYYDTSSCSNCGNNQLDGDERCDGDKRQKVYNCCQTFQCTSTCEIAKAQDCGNCGW